MPILCYNGKNEALMRRDRKTEVKKMVAIPTLFSDVLMFVLLIIPGFFMGRAGKIADSALGSMTNILMYIAMPFLVFSKLIETDLRTLSPIAVMVCMTAPIAVIALIVGMSSFVFPQHEGDTHWRASRFCAAFANCGFLGIPLASVLFPAYPEVAVYVSLYNVVNTFLLLTVGVYILSGDRRDISIRRALVSPIAGAIMLGLLCAVFDLASVMSRIAIYSGHLASLTTPLSMIVLGVELSKVKPSTLIQTRALYPVALLKLVAAPMLICTLLLILRLIGVPLPQTLIVAIFLATAVSTAASAPAMSQKYGVDGGFAAILTLGCTVMCALTLPLLYLILELFLF